MFKRLLYVGIIAIFIIIGFYAYGVYAISNASFNKASVSTNREIDHWPPITQWKTYSDKDFGVTFQYPDGWEVAKPTDNSAIVIGEKWAGTSLVIHSNPRDNRDIQSQLIDLLHKYSYPTYLVKNIRYIRDDFAEISEPLPEETTSGANIYVPISFLIQEDTIYSILYVNYGAWTGNGRNQKYIDALNRGLLIIAHTIESTSK